MKCADCKHWCQDVFRRVGEEPEVRKCEKIKMFWDSTDWDSTGDNRVFIDDSLAFVQDGSDYYAELLTKPDFCCIMWEAQ